MTATSSMAHSGAGDRTFRDDIQRVGQDVTQIKKDISTLAKDASGAAHTGLGVAKESLTHSLEVAKEQGDKAVETLRDTVVKHPLTSVGVAAGVGLLVGIVLFRPRS